MLFELLIAVATLLIAMILLSMRKFNYWKNKNVKYLTPVPLFGNYADKILHKRNPGESIRYLCMKLPEEPMFGAFYSTEPVLVVQDPALVHLVMVKDYYYFNCREVSEHEHKEVMNKSLFFTSGDTWKVLRSNLAPVFTPLKLKNMYHLIESNARTLELLLDREVQASPTMNIKTLFSRFTLDCISACAFGIESHAMNEEVEVNPFRQMADVLVQTSNIYGIFLTLKQVWPSIFYGLGLKTFPDHIYHFFESILNKVVNVRNNTPSQRQDIVDFLLEMKNNNCISGKPMKKSSDTGDDVQIKVDQEMLVSQCVVFFGGGFETSSSTLGFIMYELAKHPEEQERVINEVDAYLASHNGSLNYDVMTELPYTEQCVNEVLRMYPILSLLTREVYEDYTFPNGVTLEKGMRVHIPVEHLHKNPKYFPNPEEFIPDRFSPKEIGNIVPGSYLPFGLGPRTCIGMRFGRLQMYTGLATLLKKYRVELAPGMPRSVTFEPAALLTVNREPLMLTLVERENWQERVFK